MCNSGCTQITQVSDILATMQKSTRDSSMALRFVIALVEENFVVEHSCGIVLRLQKLQ